MALYDTQNRLCYFIHLHCSLVVSLVASSSLSFGTPANVYSTVGSQAVLPCSWKSQLGDASLPACHIQWQTPDDTVLEQKGEEKWQAEEFQGRVEVPKDRLDAGDCSLIMSDVQFGDTGLYESFMVVEGARMNKRVFIQAVQLSVHDHKSRQSHRPGQDMLLDLHTPRSHRVVFQGRNSSTWSDLWKRGDRNTLRLQKDTDREWLTVRRLKWEDEGTYKVLNEDGLSLSTVQLSLEERATAVHEEQHSLYPIGDATKSSCSWLLLALGLSVSPLMLHIW